MVDLQLGGVKFTRSIRQFPPTMPRLDRLLVSVEWMDLFPKTCQIAMPKPLSDHCQGLLDTQPERWGPNLFRFELMWLEGNELAGLIENWWKGIRVDGRPGFALFIKIKIMKFKIKE